MKNHCLGQLSLTLIDDSDLGLGTETGLDFIVLTLTLFAFCVLFGIYPLAAPLTDSNNTLHIKIVSTSSQKTDPTFLISSSSEVVKKAKISTPLDSSADANINKIHT